jgi:predicted dinucleotide-binding enzyme
MDVSNALDFSHGTPPTLTVANTDSVAEQIQRTYPAARVVKALNTVNSAVMTDPGHIPGKHVVFIAGDDNEAKATVRSLLGEFGWAADTIIDLAASVSREVPRCICHCGSHSGARSARPTSTSRSTGPDDRAI